MPRGVTKTKDGGVGKGNGDDKKNEKRSRKMRGGDKTFKVYCDDFLKENKDNYNRMIGEIDAFLQEYLNPDEKGSRFPGSRKSELYSLIEGINTLRIYKTLYPTDNSIFTQTSDVDFRKLLLLYNEIKKQIDKTQTGKTQTGKTQTYKTLEDLQKIYKKIIFCKIFMLIVHFKNLCDDGNNMIANINIPDKDVAAKKVETGTQLVVSQNVAPRAMERTNEGSVRQQAVTPPSGVPLLSDGEGLLESSLAQLRVSPSGIPRLNKLKGLPSIVTGSEGSSATTSTPLPSGSLGKVKIDGHNFLLDYDLDKFISNKTNQVKGGEQIGNKKYKEKMDEWMKSDEYISAKAVLDNRDYPDEIKKKISELFSNIYIDISNYYYSNEIDDLFTKIIDAHAKMKEYITTIESEDIKGKLNDALVAYIKFYKFKRGIDMLLKHKGYLRTLEGAIEKDMIETRNLLSLNDKKTLNINETIEYLENAYAGLQKNKTYVEIIKTIDNSEYNKTIRKTIKEDILGYRDEGYINKLIKKLQSVKNKKELIELIEQFIRIYKYSTFKKLRLANIRTYEDETFQDHISNFAEQFKKTYIDAVKIAMVANAHYIYILEKFKKHLQEERQKEEEERQKEEEEGDEEEEEEEKRSEEEGKEEEEVVEEERSEEEDFDTKLLDIKNYPSLEGLIINKRLHKNKISVLSKIIIAYKAAYDSIKEILKERNTDLSDTGIEMLVFKILYDIIYSVVEILNIQKYDGIGSKVTDLNEYYQQKIRVPLESIEATFKAVTTDTILEGKRQANINKINELKLICRNFSTYCHDIIVIPYRNNRYEGTWYVKGGQPQKPPRKKPTKTPKPKTPKPKEPKPTKTPDPKPKTPKPTKDPKPKPTKKATKK